MFTLKPEYIALPYSLGAGVVKARGDVWKCERWACQVAARMTLGLRPTNERRRYFVTTSLIG